MPSATRTIGATCVVPPCHVEVLNHSALSAAWAGVRCRVTTASDEPVRAMVTCAETSRWADRGTVRTKGSTTAMRPASASRCERRTDAAAGDDPAYVSGVATSADELISCRRVATHAATAPPPTPVTTPSATAVGRMLDGQAIGIL